jgi:uncharacterized integral membrane protein
VAGETGRPAREGPKRPDRRRDVRLVLMGVMAVLLVWFALANLQDVEIHFWVYSTRASLVTVVAVSGLLGAFIGVMVSRRRKHPESKSPPPDA